MANMEMQWIDGDLPDKRSDAVYVEFASELRKNPGRWAKWPREYDNPSSVHAVRRNILDSSKRTPVPFRKGVWEAEVRSKVLYVRFVSDS